MKFKYTEEQAQEEYTRKIKSFSNGLTEIRTYAKPIKRIKKGYELSKNDVLNKIDPFNEYHGNFEAYQKLMSLSNEEKQKLNTKNENKEYRISNLTRSRNLIIDLACENVDEWKSFITLTFAENLSDIDIANKHFANYVRQLKRVDSNFKYLCVPEYQKRGAVHYHMMTNLVCGTELVPKREKKKLFNPSTKSTTEIEFYDLKYWNHGYSSAYDLVNGVDEKFNPALYITKYLYKDIDDRLFGRKKVLRSNNLRLPNIEYLSKNNPTYNDAIDYIEKKGYSTNDYCPPITNEYQIPCLVQQIQLSRDDLAEFSLYQIVGDDALL